ncbi:hypothetical protein H8356DRAFT_1372176 [Neocallimastix lanati (nom. inval.)]|nr:hypothetical protein H8356DRAFT_1372176 [Neocallimastix sp. JGI-2020a]
MVKIKIYAELALDNIDDNSNNNKNIKNDNDIFVLDMKLKNDANSEFRNFYQGFYKALISAIVKAIDMKNIDILKLLLYNLKGNIHLSNYYKVYPIKLAVDSKNLNIVNLFAEKHSNINDEIIYCRKFSILYKKLKGKLKKKTN